jgi:hypothetical protein
MYLLSFISSYGLKSPLEWAWSPFDSNDSNLQITVILTFASCITLNPNAPLSFVVYAIASNVPSSFVVPSNVTILGLDDFFVDPILQDYQVHDDVPFDVYHL